MSPRLNYLDIIYFVVFKALAFGKNTQTHHMPQGSSVILQIVTEQRNFITNDVVTRLCLCIYLEH